MDQQLLAYIEQELKRGVRPEVIQKALCAAGWESGLVKDALAAVQSGAAAPFPQAVSAPSGEIARQNSDSLAPAATESPSKILSTAKIVFGVVALIFAAITVYLYLSDSFGSPTTDDADLLFGNEMAPPQSPGANSNEGGLVVSPIGQTDSQNAAGADVVDGVAPAEEAATTTIAAPAVGEQAKDEKRKTDMRQLSDAQKAWFAANEKYYTCGLAGGDCGGKVRGYPVQIGDLSPTPQDPSGLSAGICGKDYVYCGLNNASYSHFFCYYAKLESGGYYTASHEGNFLRKTLPKIFEECAVSDLD